MGPLEQQCTEAMTAPMLATPAAMDALNFATPDTPIEISPQQQLTEVVIPLIQGLRDAVRILARHLDERNASGPVVES
jgi:hypothetical protein